MNVPVLSDPVGDPVGVRMVVARLVAAAESVGVVARGLSDLNQEAVLAWEGNAQRLFSLLASVFAVVVAGSGRVAGDAADALSRYSSVLEDAKSEVRVCRQQLDSLVATTPVGMVPDPAAVNNIVGRANQAYARVGQAARELSAAVLGLIRSPTANQSVPAPNDAQVSFVSRAHNGGLASTHPTAAGFDVQAAQIETQINGIMNSFTGLVTAETRPAPPNSSFYLSTTILGGNNVSFSDPSAPSTTILGGNNVSFAGPSAPGTFDSGGSWSPGSNEVFITESATPVFPVGASQPANSANSQAEAVAVEILANQSYIERMQELGKLQLLVANGQGTNNLYDYSAPTGRT